MGVSPVARREWEDGGRWHNGIPLTDHPRPHLGNDQPQRRRQSLSNGPVIQEANRHPIQTQYANAPDFRHGPRRENLARNFEGYVRIHACPVRYGQDLSQHERPSMNGLIGFPAMGMGEVAPDREDMSPRNYGRSG
jgi:hypothetical protein